MNEGTDFSQELLANARRALARHKEQIAVLEKFLADYSADAVPPRKKQLTSGQNANILILCTEVLRAAGQPLPASAVLRRLRAAGYPEIPGDYSRPQLTTAFIRSGRFTNVKGRGYWPKELGAPA